MRVARHILSLLLIVTVVYVGAGVPITHYCCEACAAMGVEGIENGACHKIHHEHKKTEGCCQHSHQEEQTEDECELNIVQLDLSTRSQNDLVEMPPPLPLLLNSSAIDAINDNLQLAPIPLTAVYNTPPLGAYTSRYYLHLYAILLI